jgi:hypothetical protein
MIAPRMDTLKPGALPNGPLPAPAGQRSTASAELAEAAAWVSGRQAWLTLAVCGAGSMLAYLALLGVIRELATSEPSYVGQVLRWVPVLTRETLDKQPGPAALRFLALLGGLFGLYLVALRALDGQRSGRLELAVFGLGGLFLAIQVTQPAMLSTDVYAYAMYGRIAAIYGGDPYVQVHNQYPDDPFMPLTYFLPWPSWYGQLWTSLSAGLALLAGERIGLTVLLYRLLAAGSALAAAGAIWLSLRQLAQRRAAQGVAFFLWNPLLILESGMSGHNDALMAALLLLGLALFVRGHRIAPVVFFSLSVLVKLVTGLLLPLYILLLLRAAPGWSARLRLLALCGLAAGLTLLAIFGLARTTPRMPVADSASAAYFYDNNVYQLLLPGLRVWFGEEPASARVPVHFYPWWGRISRATLSLATPRVTAERIERLAEDTLVLVIVPEDDGWVTVHNPASGRRGYVREDALAKTARPDELANANPLLGRLELNPATGPIAQRANDLIRLGTWLLFGAIYLLAAWQAADRQRFLVWAAVVFLAAYWLIATEIWPWYVIWALALAALAPTSRRAVLAGLLSATVLTLYVTIGYERTAQSWLFTYRSLPAFVLPLALFGFWWVASRLLGRRQQARELS